MRLRKITPRLPLAIREIINNISTDLASFGDLANVPRAMMRNYRNDMYLVSKALPMKSSGKPAFTDREQKVLDNYGTHVDRTTKFFPVG